MRVWALWGSVVLALVGAGVARADVKMSGTFVADSACPATQA
ncbi:ribonuclease, partial [Mesorhizobium sp. M1E.F.Ca.ET.063.01.1.1]